MADENGEPRIISVDIPVEITVKEFSHEDKNILEGNISMKGRIYGVFLIKTALELYFNKNIKYVIRRWKHKHKED